MDPTLAALHQHFGFAAFRPGQQDAVDAAAAGRDVLVVMPTGAGKSLCYQLPALMREDLTLVVSPLISLMQDQVEALERVAPGRAALVNAQQPPQANRAAVARAAAGELRLLYVAPERFSSAGFLEQVRRVRVGLFVVDEAHCVSQWGHDFRPDYFRLADAARWLGAEAIIASTATATPQVAADIVARLRIGDAVRVTTGFDRPNLSFSVVSCSSPAERHRRVIAAVADPAARPAIVYAGTRKATAALAAELEGALGEEVLTYHAGMGREDRARSQRRFMSGAAGVVVATSAFGMGVDKADVRTVVHSSVPPSVEAYYQEAGRAGRDGRPATALLLAEGRDKGLHAFFIARAEVRQDAIARVEQRLREGALGGRFDLATAELERDGDRARAIVGHLARAGVVRLAPGAPDRVRGRILAPLDTRTLAACATAAGEAHRARWRQYRAVWSFVERDCCRRVALLRHFGDRCAPAPEVPCCDVCSTGLGSAGPGASPRGRDPLAGDLDAAISAVVAGAEPAVGRDRVVEIVRGGRSRALRRLDLDGLPGYGTFGHLSAGEVLRRVDDLLERGVLCSSGGARPSLRVAGLPVSDVVAA
jgi:ATP-dependent DNA helicase RecQ